uniref:Uncharacterized protein n=1 Tax=Siphoviridae sp. ctL7J9 TaxID=2827845 RepID=A0A8S5T6M7_9CAUD|nr:MAG TPA: hypothetical protein [Siphoviridae sp. ctL7J9]
MNYDKNSFLAGISVGRTLKGWSGGNVGGTYGAAIVLQYGMTNIMPMSLSGYALTVKAEALKYGQLSIGPIKLTGED